MGTGVWILNVNELIHILKSDRTLVSKDVTYLANKIQFRTERVFWKLNFTISGQKDVPFEIYPLLIATVGKRQWRPTPVRSRLFVLYSFLLLWPQTISAPLPFFNVFLVTSLYWYSTEFIFLYLMYTFIFIFVFKLPSKLLRLIHGYYYY